MTKTKSAGLYMALWGIFFVVYNLFVYLFIDEHTKVFWISYAFMMIAHVFQIIGTYLAFKDFSVQAVFFGIPLEHFTLFYFFAELYVSVNYMIYQHISWKIPFFVQFVILAIYGVFVIISIATRDVSLEEKDRYQETAAIMRVNTIEVEMLLDKVVDAELKNSLTKLAETVRYSDPMTNETVANIENRIRQEMIALQTYCDDNDVNNAKESCAKLQRLYVERNKRLMASK